VDGKRLKAKTSKEATANHNIQSLQDQQESSLEMTNKNRASPEEQTTIERELLNQKFAGLEEQRVSLGQELEEMNVLNKATANRNAQALQDQQQTRTRCSRGMKHARTRIAESKICSPAATHPLPLTHCHCNSPTATHPLPLPLAHIYKRDYVIVTRIVSFF
jgi:hypothetical protein